MNHMFSVVSVLAALTVLAGCSAPTAAEPERPGASGAERTGRPGASGAEEKERPTVSAAELSGPTVVAVGDIACARGNSVAPKRCRHADTAKLAQSYSPTYVLGLGDMQYPSAALSDFNGSYDKSWGALKARTRPVPGNHEYLTPGASGYYSYFRNQQPGRPGYYAFDVNGWRIYALNSVCTKIDCAQEIRWMERDMANHPRRCSAIAMHHPRFSSGSEHGSTPEAGRFWKVAYRHHVDLALAGHDHDYERFARMDPAGAPAGDGVYSFVSGASGKGLYEFGKTVSGSEARYNQAPGVLALTLGRTQFAYEFKNVNGNVIDKGVHTCG